MHEPNRTLPLQQLLHPKPSQDTVPPNPLLILEPMDPSRLAPNDQTRPRQSRTPLPNDAPTTWNKTLPRPHSHRATLAPNLRPPNQRLSPRLPRLRQLRTQHPHPNASPPRNPRTRHRRPRTNLRLPNHKPALHEIHRPPRRRRRARRSKPLPVPSRPARIPLLARRKTACRDCRLDRQIVTKWHYLPALPELCICEDCFDEVVWPFARHQRPIARSFRLLGVPCLVMGLVSSRRLVVSFIPCACGRSSGRRLLLVISRCLSPLFLGGLRLRGGSGIGGRSSWRRSLRGMIVRSSCGRLLMSGRGGSDGDGLGFSSSLSFLLSFLLFLCFGGGGSFRECIG